MKNKRNPNNDSQNSIKDKENFKNLSKEEKFVSEITWGGIPEDFQTLSERELYQMRLEAFNSGTFKELWEYELSKSKKPN